MLCFSVALLTLTTACVGTPVGPKTAGAALAGLAIATKLAEDECDDVGVSLEGINDYYRNVHRLETTCVLLCMTRRNARHHPALSA